MLKNLFIFLSTKDLKYGVYCLYLAVVWSSNILFIEGWNNYFIEPSSLILRNNMAVISIYAQIVMIFTLTAIFIDAKKSEINSRELFIFLHKQKLLFD